MSKVLPAALALAVTFAAPAALAQNKIESIELPPSLPAMTPEPITPPSAATEAQATTADVEPLATAADPALAEVLAAEIAEQRRTAALNAVTAQSAAAQIRAAEDARAAAEAEVQARYEAEVAAHEAAAAESERRHQAEMAEWRRRVAACEAGDRKACRE